MAFPFRGGPQSPRDDPFPSYSNNPLSPQRNPNRLSAGLLGTQTSPSSTANEARAGLTRRFTTNALPTLSPIGQQRRLAAGDTSQGGSYSRLPPSEQKYRHYEQLLAEQRRIQAFIEQVDPDLRREVDENRRHEHTISEMLAQSEPTTPPEYADAFPSALGRPNRYSSASLTSPPGILNRPSRSNTQLTSPPSHYTRPFSNHSNLPSQSVPGSRRQSDDEEEDDDFLYNFDTSVHRAAANPNRNSMPVTGYDRKRNNLPDLSQVLGPVNTTSFLFGDEDKHITILPKGSKTSPSDGKTFLQVQHTADGFPKLIRREENGTTSIADPSAALDLALGPSSNKTAAEQQPTDRLTAARHRISLPPSALRNNDANIAAIGSILTNQDKPPNANRRSVEFNLATETKRPSLMASSNRGYANGNAGSYSTNDLPTLKSVNGTITSPKISSSGTNITSPRVNINGTNGTNNSTRDNTAINSSNGFANNSSNGFANNANGGFENRLTSSHSNAGFNNNSQQDFDNRSESTIKPSDHQANDFDRPQSGYQNNPYASFVNAPPFSPASQLEPQLTHNFAPAMSPYQSAFYGNGGFGMQPPMQALNNGFNAMSMSGGYNGQNGYPMGMYQPSPYALGFQQPPPFQPNNAIGGAPPPRHGNMYAGLTQQQRKAAAEEAQARFKSISLSQLKGEILGLCTDQHGCRFLQKKLDERDEASVQLIFDEVHESIVRLMTDPFGNYLCQKLLENCNDEQRSVLIGNCMSNMTQIALNQHGTRALQKMIEFISTPEQTQMIIDGMRYDVVQLIQDLNGNHVIQKCLNHLSSKDAQFIFDAVGHHCIAVGTHRHGCCVLQRCVDHASGLQKGELVRQISQHAFNLVQDPFGNYVVQYIIDLNEPSFTEPMCKQFYGQVVYLSKQKFSSNVIEKCIRCASEETRKHLIQEIVPPQELEKLLRDSFANYVVQTSFDYADDEQKTALAANLRPILPSIRHTPYGRRLLTKIQELDGRLSGTDSGFMTPEDTGFTSPPQSFAQPLASYGVPTGRQNRQGFVGGTPQFYNGGGNGTYGNNNEIHAPQPKRNSGNLGDVLDATQQQNAQAYSQNGGQNGQSAVAMYGYHNGQANGQNGAPSHAQTGSVNHLNSLNGTGAGHGHTKSVGHAKTASKPRVTMGENPYRLY